MKATSFLRILMALVIAYGGVMQLQPGEVLAQGGHVPPQGEPRLQDQSGRDPQPNHLNYTVGPEDLLAVQFFGQDELNREVRVSGEGEITLPLVGAVKVAGLSPKGIEQRLMAAYSANYLRTPQISLSVKEYRHQRVSVTGAVDKPGYYDLIGPRKLLEVLAMAGGLQDKGSTAKAGNVVHIIRQRGAHQAETQVIDLTRLQVQGASELNVPIRNGDVVHVPFAGHAYILGGVKNPGSVAVRDNLSLSQALAMAGGADPVLATNQVSIMRLDANKNPITISARLDKVLSRQETDVPLQDNDVVVVNVGSLKKSLYVFKQLMPGGSVSGTTRLIP